MGIISSTSRDLWQGMRGIGKDLWQGMRGIGNSATRWFVTKITGESASAMTVRSVYLIVNLSVAAGILLYGQFYRENLHALFWLGLLPQATLLCSMLALALPFLLMVRIRCLMYFRNSRQIQRIKSERGCCNATEWCNAPRLLRCGITFMSLFSLAAFILGIVVLHRGMMRKVELKNGCRDEGTIARTIDDVHKDAVKMYDVCKKSHQNVPLHMCPGFRDKFPDPSPYIDYLARMEYADRCSGFCEAHSKPLFYMEKPEDWGKKPCADAIIEDVQLVSYSVGIGATVLGAVLLLAAALLLDFKEL